MNKKNKNVSFQKMQLKEKEIFGIYRYTDIQIHRYKNIQLNICTDIQRHRYTNKDIYIYKPFSSV